MSFFHHHHGRPNVDINVTENINEPGYLQQQQPPFQQPPFRQPYSQVSETIVKEGPYGNVEVDRITERVCPDGTVIMEEVRREGYNSGW